MKKKRTLLLSALAAGLLTTLALPKMGEALNGKSEGSQPPKANAEAALCNMSNRNKSVYKAPQRTILNPGFLYEDFETVAGNPPYPLPAGWTSLPNPENPEDTWNVGLIGSGDSAIDAASGENYAYTLSTGAEQDCWAITRSISLEAGKEYTVECAFMSVNVYDSDILLEVHVGNAPTLQAMSRKLGESASTQGEWERLQYRFTPETTGEYYIGYHCVAPGNTALKSGLFLDEVKVYEGELPIFRGSRYFDLGQGETLGGKIGVTASFYNAGSAPLTVSLKSCDPQLTITGFPMTVEAEESGEYGIAFSPTESGKFTGFFVLTTNDPTLPEVTVSVTAEIMESRVTGYHFENFENGTPEGWIFDTGGGAYTSNHALNSKFSFKVSTFYQDFGIDEGHIGFFTHFVRMGEKPEISFYYKMLDESFFGGMEAPTEADRGEVRVLISDDNCATWKSAYVIGEGGNEAHVPSANYRKITIPLEDYAGKTCRLRVDVHQKYGDSFTQAIGFYVDDIAIGTPPTCDMSADFLTGTAALKAGEEGTANVEIANMGQETVEEYTVKLLDKATEQVLGSVEKEQIAAGEKVNVTIPFTISEPGRKDLYVKVEAFNDVNEKNNVTLPLYVDVLAESNKDYDYAEGKELYGRYPFNFYNDNVTVQTIYDATELGITGGSISGISYRSKSNAPMKADRFEMYIGETLKPDFSDWAIVDLSSLTKVFDGEFCFPSGQDAEVVIPFQTPYEYKGGNLVVAFHRDSEIWMEGIDFKQRQTPGKFSSVIKIPNPNMVTREVTVAASMPQIRFHMVDAPSGILQGKVYFADGKQPTAKVSIDGTVFSTLTDASGNYSFPRVAVGSYKVSFDCHGYYPSAANAVNVTESGTSTLNQTLNPLPLKKISGKVTDKFSGKPVKGVEVALRGYHDYSAVTDAEGSYEFPAVFADSGEQYVISTSGAFFENAVGKANPVGADLTKDFLLEPSVLRPGSPEVAVTGEGAVISWGEPKGELRHDNGKMDHYLGYPGGQWYIMMGSVFPGKATISEVSWYATDEESPHSNFNVFIFGLDADGLPDNKNILYEARNVDYTDDAWSVHKLPEPLEVDGCLIAISCTGFLGIGVTKSDDAYPFSAGMHYYAGESYTMGFFDFVSFEDSHLMIRATIDDEASCSRPEMTYDLYRFIEGQSRSKWQKVASTSSTSFKDTDFATLKGRYQYAVVARYGDKESAPVISDVVIPTEITNVAADATIKLRLDRMNENILIDSGEALAELSVYNMQGVRVMQVQAPGEKVAVSHLPAGAYVARVKTEAGLTKTIKILKK